MRYHQRAVGTIVLASGLLLCLVLSGKLNGPESNALIWGTLAWSSRAFWVSRRRVPVRMKR